jgi:hypothetical protein
VGISCDSHSHGGSETISLTREELIELLAQAADVR